MLTIFPTACQIASLGRTLMIPSYVREQQYSEKFKRIPEKCSKLAKSKQTHSKYD